VLPVFVVDGVGAVDVPLPPVALVYQMRLFPLVEVAVSATAVIFWQRDKALVVGAVGLGYTLILKSCTLEQPLFAAVTAKLTTPAEAVVLVSVPPAIFEPEVAVVTPDTLPVAVIVVFQVYVVFDMSFARVMV
jgi:hypothetical protein